MESNVQSGRRTTAHRLEGAYTEARVDGVCMYVCMCMYAHRLEGAYTEAESMKGCSSPLC